MRSEDVEKKKLGLPPTPFLYTLDQIGVIISVAVPVLKQNYLYFEGRSLGARPKHKIMAHDITPRQEGLPPDWRVSEREFIRWMKYQGFKYYATGYFA